LTAGSKSSPSAHFVISVLPWLLAGGMLLVYVRTLDYRVSLENLRPIARLTGIDWVADISAPVTYAVTYPIHWLPAAAIPFAANFFTACCAALTLMLLARSVALLPQDRTRAQRQRNPDRHGLLGTGNAWLPPTLAVLVCGLQLSFWENAIAMTGEMFNLLLFALMVWCLLEFRRTEKNSWLLWLSFLNGLGAANNWAMVAFLPGFLFAVLWMKGFFNFFNPAYVAAFLKEGTRVLHYRLPLAMLACWAAGAVWFLLMPLVVSHSRTNHLDFWPDVTFGLRTYQAMLTLVPLRTEILLGLTSVFPIAFMGIHWDRLIRDPNPGVIIAAEMLFHLIHAFFLGICLWAALGSPLSPRHLLPQFPCLPLYFLLALSVGYYSGYFLLVFAPRTDKPRRRGQPQASPIHLASVALVALLTLLAPAGLADGNLREILRRKTDALAGYFEDLEKSLPGKGSVILSEDSLRLQYLGTRLSETGRRSDYLLIDTGLLARFPSYFRFLDARNPEFALSAGLTNQVTEITNPAVLMNWVSRQAGKHELYFLHPFAGVLGEYFFPRSQGLFFHLEPYAANTLFAPPLSPDLVARNQGFWRALDAERFPGVVSRIQPPQRSPGVTPWQRFLKKANVLPEADQHAFLAGRYYSVALNAWGVELQEMGSLPGAGKMFESACQLNPQNISAQINAGCNRDLRAGHALTVDTSPPSLARFERGRDWDQTLRADGPVDEPTACYMFGTLCADERLYRQAVQHLERSQTLAPQSTNAPLKLAELFLLLGQYTNALTAASRELELAPGNQHALVLQGVARVALGRYDQALPPLNAALALQPGNVDALLGRAQAYLKMENFKAAREDFEAALLAQPKAYPAYYGLANIAVQTKDSPAAIKNCESYLSCAPPERPETAQVKSWLERLKPPNPGAQH
jgi:tetratricopeptide (TPR) repeat protein